MSETPPPYTGKPAPKATAAPKTKPAAAKTTAASKAPATSRAKTQAAVPAPVPPVATVPAPAPVPAMPATAAVVSYVTIWHSRALLIGVAAFAALAGIGTSIGAFGFPDNAPVESIYAFGIVVDMLAVVIALAILTITEYRRRTDPVRLGLPVNPRPSVFAILAVALAGLTLLAWVVGEGPTQLIDLAAGLRARYMYHTGGLFAAGIPWALSLIFGAWGFRPKGMS